MLRTISSNRRIINANKSPEASFAKKGLNVNKRSDMEASLTIRLPLRT